MNPFRKRLARAMLAFRKAWKGDLLVSMPLRIGINRYEIRYSVTDIPAKVDGEISGSEKGGGGIFTIVPLPPKGCI